MVLICWLEGVEGAGHMPLHPQGLSRECLHVHGRGRTGNNFENKSNGHLEHIHYLDVYQVPSESGVVWYRRTSQPVLLLRCLLMQLGKQTILCAVTRLGAFSVFCIREVEHGAVFRSGILKVAVNKLGCLADLFKGYPCPVRFRYLKPSSLGAHSEPRG